MDYALAPVSSVYSGFELHLDSKTVCYGEGYEVTLPLQLDIILSYFVSNVAHLKINIMAR